ncbi:transcription factor 21-like [Anneissia japonica]|uniref:transcription factor 21-like n=1 Tax=Anneissia japonica TaxID=1529436 RepID=UPI0014257095|nr:transcription factor 21-like [Anneissia japonica]
MLPRIPHTESTNDLPAISPTTYGGIEKERTNNTVLDGSIKQKKTSKRIGPRAPIKPVQRMAANARERARMRVLSQGFSMLKTTLPWVPADTKLSKLDTLRLASSYIAHLRSVLDDEEPQDSSGTHPINLNGNVGERKKNRGWAYWMEGKIGEMDEVDGYE